MFSKSQKPQPKNPRGSEKKAPVKAVVPSIISQNLRISGNLATEGDVQVEGIVDGDVASKLLTVGESATINGAIMADVVRISGTVNGEITGRVVELAKTANITGDINHHSLAIEAGAFVQGLCWHIDDKRQGIAGALPKPNLVVAGSDGGKKDNDETAPKAETGKAAAG